MFLFDSQIISIPTIIAASALLVLANVIEFFTKRNPNWLTVSGVLAGIGLAFHDGLWLLHALGLIIGLVLGMIPFLIGATGAGSTKLTAAVGCILGPVSPMVIFGLLVALVAVLIPFHRNSARDEDGDAGLHTASIKSDGSDERSDDESSMEPPGISSPDEEYQRALEMLHRRSARRAPPWIGFAPFILAGTVIAIVLQLWLSGRVGG